MFSRQEHHSDDQVICWNCEEAVHQSAIVCPYCNVEIHRHAVEKVSGIKKITPISQEPLSHVPQSPQNRAFERSSFGQTFSFLSSLFLLLSGSALFFLAVIIAFFARDGAFTLTWPEHSWPAFFGLGIALLAIGTLCLQKLSGGSEESAGV